MILVTGANGMLGNAVVDQLLARGNAVRSFDLTPHPNPQVESIVGDVRNLDAIREACKEVTGVIHTASLVDLHLGRPQRLYDINVHGVENVITACRDGHVSKLVYMSTAEVICGAAPLRYATEEAPYPTHHLTYYGVTKEAAERRILAANGEQLATCAFRTFGIFGEGDRNFIRRALGKTKRKEIPRLGANPGLTDTVYAGNVAHALILGLAKLEVGGPVSGQIFHVTDREPHCVQGFLLEILRPLGYKQLGVTLHTGVAMFIVRFFESRYQLTRAERFANPLLTRHQLLLSTQDYYLASSKVKALLGYSPKFTREEAIQRTQAWLLQVQGSTIRDQTVN